MVDTIVLEFSILSPLIQEKSRKSSTVSKKCHFSYIFGPPAARGQQFKISPTSGSSSTHTPPDGIYMPIAKCDLLTERFRREKKKNKVTKAKTELDRLTTPSNQLFYWCIAHFCCAICANIICHYLLLAYYSMLLIGGATPKT